MTAPRRGPLDVAVVADTHLSGAGRLPAALAEVLSGADVVLHAGDVTSRAALDELRTLTRRLEVVRGNNDRDLPELPAELILDLDGLAVALVHDSGPARGRAARLARRFPAAALVVFGHSHVPVDEPGLAGQRLFNPGSPTQRRRQPVGTFGRLAVAGGRLRRAEVVALGAPAPARLP